MKKYDKIANLTNKLLEEIGEDPKREGLYVLRKLGIFFQTDINKILMI